MFTLYSIIHDVEIWLAIAIWSCGAIFGICMTMIGRWIGEKHDKYNASTMDRPYKRLRGDAPRGDFLCGGMTDDRK